MREDLQALSTGRAHSGDEKGVSAVVSAALLATCTVTVHCIQNRPPFLPRRLPKVRSLPPGCTSPHADEGRQLGSWV